MKKQFLVLAIAIAPFVIISCSKEKRDTAKVQNSFEEPASTNSTGERTQIDPLTVNLEGWFPFDATLKDKTKKLLDAISTKRSVIYTTDRKGNFNSAIRFDSTYGIKIKSIPQQTHTSLSVWFKPGSMTQVSTHIVANLSYGPSLFHAMNIVGGAVSVFPYGNIGDYAGTINTGWHHGVVTYDGASVKVYIDNFLKVNYIQAAEIPVSLADFFVGYLPGWEYWKGSVDELRFYSRTLTATDVNKLYLQ